MSTQNLKYLVLAIESSCDETSLALLALPDLIYEENDYNLINNVKILGSIISSQIKIHEKYGGVVPEIGARMHAEQIHFIWTQMLENTNKELLEEIELSKNNLENKNLTTQSRILLSLDKIMVTTNPGLVSALRVGQEFAKTIKFFSELEMHKFSITKTVDIIEVNHLRGHLASSFYQSYDSLISK
jgi:N6-L-threonylcarbamoyladenine synthase